MGYEVPDSHANFVLIRFGNEPGKTARDADDFLVTKRLILRSVASYGLPDCLRMTIGLAEENRAVLDALREFTNR
jgi:histidinol-phosphate aminotransferase